MPKDLSIKAINLALAGLLYLPSCATVQLSQWPAASPPASASRIEPDQAVAILTFAPVESSLETEAVNCVSQSLKAIFSNLRVITAEEFRGTIFAYRIPDDEIERAKYVDLLINHPALREQIGRLKIRYLILLHGKTASRSQAGFIGASPGGGLFLVTWDRKSNLAASIVEVASARAVSELTSASSGTAWLIFPVPLIGLPAPTEALACKSIGEAVANFLAGRGNQEATKDTQTQTE